MANRRDMGHDMIYPQPNYMPPVYGQPVQYPQRQSYYQKQYQQPMVYAQQPIVQQKPKKSGAVYTRITKGVNEGLYAVNAWRKTKFGLQTAKAFPAKRDEISVSQNGNEFVKYGIEISNSTLGISQLYWTLMDLRSRKLFIKELDLVISPNGSGVTSGGQRVTGYFGKAYDKNNPKGKK